jgi:hypothetical protein
VLISEIATTDADMKKFFEAHDYSIYVVLSDYFAYRLSKIRQKGAHNSFIDPKPSILQNKDTIHSKEVFEILEIVEVFHKLLKYCNVKQGWQRHGFVKFIESMLIVDNDHKIRKEGLNLLLMFLDCQTEDSKEASLMYSTIINMYAFEAPPVLEPRSISQSHFIGKDEDGLMARNMAAETYVPWVESQSSPKLNKKVAKSDKLEAIVPRTAGKENDDNVELLERLLKYMNELAMNIASKIQPKSISV